MSEDDESEQAIELGERTPVEGAPLARVSSRLHWPTAASEIERLEGESVIRTPDGPVELADVLAEVEEPYFQTRQEFERHVRAVIGTGPVRTAE